MAHSKDHNIMTNEITKFEMEGWVPIATETNQIIAIDSYYGDTYRMVDITPFGLTDDIYFAETEELAKASFHDSMMNICGEERYIPQYKMQKYKITINKI